MHHRSRWQMDKTPPLPSQWAREPCNAAATQHSTKTGKGRWHFRASRVTSTAVGLRPSALSGKWILSLLPPTASMRCGRGGGRRKRGPGHRCLQRPARSAGEEGCRRKRGPGHRGLLEPTVLAASGCPESETKCGSPARPIPLRAASLSQPLAPSPH